MATLSKAQVDLLHKLERGEAAESRQGRTVQLLLNNGFIRPVPFAERATPDHKYALTDAGKRVVVSA